MRVRTVSVRVVRRTYRVSPLWDRPDVSGTLRGRIVAAGSGSRIAGGDVRSISAEPSGALTIRPRHSEIIH